MAQVPPPLTQYATLTQAGVNTLDADLLQVGSECMVYGGIAGGTANSITVNIPLALADYYIGMELDFIASANNTAAPTITVTTPAGTLATLAIADQVGTALGANGIVSGSLTRLKLCADGAGALTFRTATASVPVSSVFGRTGAVVAANGDYSIGQITGAGTMASQNANAIAVTGGTMSGVAVTGLTGAPVVRAWVTFDGTTGTAIASYNVNSVTRTGVGLYSINIAGGVFPDTSYGTMMCVSSATGGGPQPIIGFGQPTSATVFTMSTVISINNTASDSTPVTVAFLHI